MVPTEARRFSISDIMILIPAAALGMLLLRADLPGHAWQLSHLPGNTADPWGLWWLYAWARGPGSCVVVPLMAAVIAMRLRRPRPRRRLIGQPGFVACLAVWASLLPGLLRLATIAHRAGFQGAQGFEQAWGVATDWADTAVLGSWGALALSRRWRPEPSWIDRMGRALGWYWVFLFFAMLAIPGLLKIQPLLSRGGPP